MGANPCQQCGACCATYRIEFYRGEVDNHPDGMVPVALTEPCGATTACMRGSEGQPQRCIALRGEIGIQVACAIYDRRPGPCREFAPLALLGEGDEACNDARRRHGLPPLVRS